MQSLKCIKFTCYTWSLQLRTAVSSYCTNTATFDLSARSLHAAIALPRLLHTNSM